MHILYHEKMVVLLSLLFWIEDSPSSIQTVLSYLQQLVLKHAMILHHISTLSVCTDDVDVAKAD